jgi:transposase InsO family protein
MMLVALAGWVNEQQLAVIEYLKQENRVLREQVARNLIGDFSGFLREKRFLIHDRDPLFTRGFRELLQSAGVTSVWMPPRSPNLNAFAERFVLSIESECLNRLVILGERIQTAATVYPHQDSRMCGRASRCRAAITDSAAGTASSKKCKSTLNKRYHL